MLTFENAVASGAERLPGVVTGDSTRTRFKAALLDYDRAALLRTGQRPFHQWPRYKAPSNRPGATPVVGSLGSD